MRRGVSTGEVLVTRESGGGGNDLIILRDFWGWRVGGAGRGLFSGSGIRRGRGHHALIGDVKGVLARATQGVNGYSGKSFFEFGHDVKEDGVV